MVRSYAVRFSSSQRTCMLVLLCDLPEILGGCKVGCPSICLSAHRGVVSEASETARCCHPMPSTLSFHVPRDGCRSSIPSVRVKAWVHPRDKKIPGRCWRNTGARRMLPYGFISEQDGVRCFYRVREGHELDVLVTFTSRSRATSWCVVPTYLTDVFFISYLAMQLS
ncbi:unnamed protein product [Ectocarpus sp. 12 AP-2014]